MTDPISLPPEVLWTPHSRRYFLRTVGLAAAGASVAAACASEPDAVTTPTGTGPPRRSSPSPPPRSPAS